MMKIVNRGYISITPKKPFWEWAGSFEDVVVFTEEDGVDPNIYLITEDFFDVEPIVEQHFKKIFKNELSMITENEEDWPEERTLETFLEWFEPVVGLAVFDLEKSNLTTESSN